MKKIAIWLTLALAMVFGDSRVAAAADGLIAIDVLLLPDATMVRRVEAINQQLLQDSAGGFALDATHAPHMTLLQCYVRRADLAAVEKAVDAVFVRDRPAGLRLTATGLFNSPLGGMSATGILVGTTPALAQLHEDIVAAVMPFIRHGGTAAAFVDAPTSATIGWTAAYVDHFLINSSGSKFAPHVTAGAGSPQYVKLLVSGPFSPLSFTITGAAIYQLGDIGTARKQLWVWHP